MSTDRSSLTLSLFLALGAGALLGLSAATQKERLPAIGGPKPLLEGAAPLPVIEIGFGPALAEVAGRLRGTIEQVPEAIRTHLGFAPAQMSFKEDVNLEPNGYVVRLRGLPVSHGRIQPGRLLALRTIGDTEGDDLPGTLVTEPATGREGAWITEEDAGRARLFGYDVLEPDFVIALQVDTVLRRHLFELLTREETYRLLDRAKQTAPRTVEELTGRLEVGTIQRVLQNLLREQVSLRDLPQVLELVADAARAGQEAGVLTESVRAGLARQLSAALADEEGVLHVLRLEAQRLGRLQGAKPGDEASRDAVNELRPRLDAAREAGLKPVLLAPGGLRADVRRALERDLPELPVLAEHEVEPGFRVQTVDARALEAR